MMTFVKPLALGLMMATPAAAFDMGAMTPAERQDFRAEIREYLMENPEVLMEAIGVLEQRQAQQQAVADDAMVLSQADALYSDINSWEGGNPEGDITLVEFVDYRCGYCRKAHSEVEELVSTDGNIRLIVKEFPILGEASVVASRFAIATKLTLGDDAYKAAHDALISMRADVNEASVRKLARSLGLDADVIVAKMNSPEVSAVITANRQLGQQLQINGTPTFVMQNEMVRGYVPLDGMRDMIAEIRQQG
ncbi:DsbA family protein [Algirhabdus cladophorae]|uniref:DsbA family protein n=1 Tax=Algirhabdus cladophorae TaxID=3377108 RepID=UPI003B848D35